MKAASAIADRARALPRLPCAAISVFSVGSIPEATAASMKAEGEVGLTF
jgi:hypothetical protein